MPLLTSPGSDYSRECVSCSPCKGKLADSVSGSQSKGMVDCSWSRVLLERTSWWRCAGSLLREGCRETR